MASTVLNSPVPNSAGPNDARLNNASPNDAGPAEASRVSGKVMTLSDVIGELRSGMTIGIGGWGSRRKPMALVRALADSDLSGLTIVSYGGPDVGLLGAAGQGPRVVTRVVS